MSSIHHRNSDTSLRNLLRFLIPLLIILFAALVAAIIIKTKPVTKKQRPERLPPLVETFTAAKDSHRVTISAMGTVVPSKTITIRPSVTGEIIMVSPEFIPGGRINKGDVILKIDPADYLLDVRRKESLLNQAKAVYDLEMGHQEVAREELKLMQSTTGKTVEDTSLALRKPQLDQAKAQLATAEADLAISRLNLKRTTIRAPFNAIVTTKSADIGLQVSAQSGLGELVGTDAFWVEATVPVSQLKWISIPQTGDATGSRATVETRSGDKFTGHVIRLSSTLTDQSRLAKVIVRIDDPLGLHHESSAVPLLLGSYVSLSIEGKTLDNTISLPRSVLRNGHEVWVYQEGTLSVRIPDIIWKGSDRVYVASGIHHGDEIVSSNLSGPVNGMKLRRTSTTESTTTDPSSTITPVGKQP